MDSKIVFAVMKDLFLKNEVWKTNLNSIINLIKYYTQKSKDSKEREMLLRIDTEGYFDCQEFYFLVFLAKDKFGCDTIHGTYYKDLETAKERMEKGIIPDDSNAIVSEQSVPEFMFKSKNGEIIKHCLNFKMSGEKLKPFIKLNVL